MKHLHMIFAFLCWLIVAPLVAVACIVYIPIAVAYTIYDQGSINYPWEI